MKARSGSVDWKGWWKRTKVDEAVFGRVVKTGSGGQGVCERNGGGAVCRYMR